MYANNLDDAFSAFALGTTDEWVKSDRYMMYPEYRDEEYTYIEGRTIGDITAQISVQGEAYSQYISFMINRYYDGIDLIEMSIWIHYELKDGSGSEDSPVNVMYNDSTIRFGWVIPDKATQQSGDIKIGVWVNGTAPNTKAYILKTEEKIYTIHPGLIPGSGITQPDQTWFENFVEQMDSKVSTAQGHANDAQASKTAAAGSAKAAAESAAASAKALEDNRAYVESQKETFVGYNRRETDTKYANALVGSASGTGRVTVGDAWEAPIPDLVVAGKSEQVSTTGAQLLDLTAKIGPQEKNGVTVNINADGSISVNGTASGDTAFILDSNSHMTLEPGKNYALRGYGTDFDNSFFWQCWTKEPSNVFKDIGSGVTFLYTQKSEFNFAIIVKSGKTVNTTFRPMINEGTVPLPWEPYTGAKPSPSPDYPQEIVSTDVTAVTVTGANLLDLGIAAGASAGGATISADGGGYTISGTGALTTSFEKHYRTDIKRFLRPGNLILKSEITVPRVSIYIRDGKTVLDSMYGNMTKQITQEMLDNENVYIELLLFGSKDTVITPGTYYPMLYQDGDGTWQPYQSGTAAITLTEPLRGIGDVRDRIMCRDGVWGIERKFVPLIFSGSENWIASNTGYANKNRFWLGEYEDVIKHENDSDVAIKILCDKLPGEASGDTYRCTDGISSNVAGRIMVYIDDCSAGGADAFKAYLASNPITAIFERATPTWEPLPSATQSALNALTTYTGTTHVTITAGGPEPDVGLEYVQDTNIVIAELKKLIEGMQNVKS